MTLPLSAEAAAPPPANDDSPAVAWPHRFGVYVFDRERLRLTRDGEPVPASAQPLEILELLLARPGRVLTRAALKRALWPGCERIDTGRRLNTAMRALREALGDTAEQPRFIETIRGRGYRWVFEETAVSASQPRARPGWLMLAPIAVVVGLLASDQARVASSPRVSDGARRQFLQIASTSETEPAAALIRLDRLVGASPGYGEAQTLRARLTVQGWREAPSSETLHRAEAALRSAHKAAGASAELQALNAEVALGGRWAWAEAESRYRRALALEPGNTTARKGLAWLLLNAGRDVEAMRELEPLLARADLSEGLRAEVGWLLLRAGRTDLAAALCDAPASRHINLLSCRHSALARQGRFADAQAVAVQVMTVLQAPVAKVARVRTAAPEVGYRAFLDWQVADFGRRRLQWFQKAQLLAVAGRPDEALASLERSYLAREPALVKLRTTREFDTLRATQRFKVVARAAESAWTQTS